MAERLLYSRPADNLIDAATITVPAGTVNAAFPVANLRDRLPYSACKFTTVRGRLVFDFGTAVTIHFVALGHHNCKAGFDARIQGHATNTWTAPTLDVPFVIGAADAEGYRPNAYLDLSGEVATSFRYWSLDLDNEDNDAALILGELWLGAQTRELAQNYSWGFQRADQRDGARSFETAHGVKWTYPSIGRRRGLTGSVQARDANRDAIDAWHQACGGSDQLTVIVPDPAINDAWFVHWTTPFGYRGDFIDDQEIPIGFLEAARGRPWP